MNQLIEYLFAKSTSGILNDYGIQRGVEWFIKHPDYIIYHLEYDKEKDLLLSFLDHYNWSRITKKQMDKGIQILKENKKFIIEQIKRK